MLTVQTLEDHIFLIVGYPSPYSLVKNIDSKFNGTTIVSIPFNTQFDWIDLSPNNPPRFNIALLAKVISYSLLVQLSSKTSNKGQLDNPIYCNVLASPLGNKSLNPISSRLYIFSITTFFNL